MRLRLFARAREAAGTGDARFAARTLGELLDAAAARYGPDFTAVLDTSRVWVNGDEPGAGRATELRDDDEIAVLPPVSGGSSAIASTRPEAGGLSSTVGGPGSLTFHSMDETRRRIDRILDPAFLTGLDTRPVDDVRTMRTDCREVETELSYVRRLAQARIEILNAELDRRAAGGSLGDLIEALPKILAGDGSRGEAADARLPQHLAPSMSIAWRRGLERLVNDATLATLPTLSDEELGSTLELLRELEHQVSTVRRDLHQVMGVLDRELAARLKTAST